MGRAHTLPHEESVFHGRSWQRLPAQLIDKKEYGINTSVKPMTPQDGQQVHPL